MVRTVKHLLLAAALPTIALSAAVALAHDAGNMTTGNIMGGHMMDRGAMMSVQDRGGDMGGGMMGGNSRSGMMGQHMQGCMQMMMQGMGGAGSQGPNEQWRQR